MLLISKLTIDKIDEFDSMLKCLFSAAGVF